MLACRGFSVRGRIPRKGLRGQGVRAVERLRLRLRHRKAAEVRGARATALAVHGTGQQTAQHTFVPATGGAVLAVQLAVETVIVADLEAALRRRPFGKAALGVQQLGHRRHALAQWQPFELRRVAGDEAVGQLIEEQCRLLLSRKAGDLRGVEPAYFVEELEGDPVVMLMETTFAFLGERIDEMRASETLPFFG